MNIFWYVNVIAMIAYIALFYYKWQHPQKIQQNIFYLLLIVAIVSYFLAEGPYPIARAVAFFVLLLLDLTFLLQQHQYKKNQK